MIFMLSFVLPLILLFLVKRIIDQQAHSFRNLESKIDKLAQAQSEMRKALEEVKVAPAPQPKAWQPPVQNAPSTTPKETMRERPERKAYPLSFRDEPARKTVAVYEPPPGEVKPSWFSRWLARNPDMEKFIGENLVNKIGIAILVLGIAFFVKYAIDKQWINEAGRVSIGILCGVILVGLAHFMRNSYRSFSSVLAGGGISVFYFTIAFAFHQYALITQTAAFAIMVLITLFAVLLALLYDKIELAVIAAVGGFLTPFMLSTGEGNYIVLFSYLAILNTGLLTLAYFKRWPLLNILSLAFTALITGGWITRTLLQEKTTVSFTLVLLFVTVFYLQFLAMNMVHQLRNRAPFKSVDFSILLFLNAGYFAAGMVLLDQVQDGRYRGLFTIAAGAINLLLAAFFIRREKTDRNLLYLLVGLTLTFLTLAVPIQLEGRAITLFWSVEMVLLLWLFRQSRMQLFYPSSLIVAVLALISLLMDWAQVALQTDSFLVLIYEGPRGLVTNIVAMISFGAFAALLQKQTAPLPYPAEGIAVRRVAWMLSAVIGYLTAFYGVNLLFREMVFPDVVNVYHRLITAFFALIGLVYLHNRKRGRYHWAQPGIALLLVCYHLFSFDAIEGLRSGVLEGRYHWMHLFAHWISGAWLLAYFYYAARTMQRTDNLSLPAGRVAWIISVLLVIFFSQELQHVYVVAGYRLAPVTELLEQYGKAVLTIVWALCSFTLMWLGMHYKQRTLRIISLTVFSVALIKLFLFDLADISEGGKIAAFILLGILLLTISFMYQKLKKMIIDDVQD